MDTCKRPNNGVKTGGLLKACDKTSKISEIPTLILRHLWPCHLMTDLWGYNSRICVKKVHRCLYPIYQCTSSEFFTTHSLHSLWAYQSVRFLEFSRRGIYWLPWKRKDSQPMDVTSSQCFWHRAVLLYKCARKCFRKTSLL